MLVSQETTDHRWTREQGRRRRGRQCLLPGNLEDEGSNAEDTSKAGAREGGELAGTGSGNGGSLLVVAGGGLSGLSGDDGLPGGGGLVAGDRDDGRRRRGDGRGAARRLVSYCHKCA